MGIKPDNDGRCGFTAPHEGKRVCACLLRLRRGESVPYRNGLRTRKGRRIGSGVFPRYVPAYRTARLGYTGRYRSGTALDDQVQERISESRRGVQVCTLLRPAKLAGEIFRATERIVQNYNSP